MSAARHAAGPSSPYPPLPAPPPFLSVSHALVKILKNCHLVLYMGPERKQRLVLYSGPNLNTPKII